VLGKSEKEQEVSRLYPNGNGGGIPFHSRIGTKLIVGFLIIATITGSAGYLSLNYAHSVGEKFHLLEQQTLPTINSLGQMKVAALNIEGDTNEFFIPGINSDKVLQDLTEQKNKFNEGLNTYEDYVNRYFPDEKNLNESIRNAASTFFQTSGKLVELGQSVTPTLSPSLALEALTIEKETAENAVVKTIDTAITNEIDEVHERSEAVNAAISGSALVTLSSIIVSVIVAVVFGFFFSVHLQSNLPSKGCSYTDWNRRLCRCM